MRPPGSFNMRPPGCKKTNSWVWELIVTDKEDGSLKYCSLCPVGSAPIKCGSKARTNTSNLAYQLETKHKEDALEAKSRFKEKQAIDAHSKRSHMGEAHYVQSTIKQTLSKKVKWDVTDSRAKEFNDSVLRYIVGENRPINTLDQPFFISMLHRFKPVYKVPSRTYFTSKMLPASCRNMNKKIGNIVENCEYLSLTSDIWTSNYTQDSFMALTGHFIDSEFKRSTAVLKVQNFPDSHTGENICTMLNKIISDYSIDRSKIFLVVTDNASNMHLGVVNAGLQHIGCFLHIMHLVVTKSLFIQPGVEAVIKKVKDIVTTNKKSNVERSLFEEITIEEENDTSKYRLVQSVVIRWNSTCKMLKTFLDLRERVVIYLDRSENCESLSKQEWLKIGQVVAVLQPLMHVSEQ